MNLKACFAACVLFITASGPSYAQSDSETSFFKSVNADFPAPTPDYVKDLIAIKFALGMSGLPSSCQPGGAIAVSDIRPATADRALWNAARAGEIKNAWTAKVRLAGCGAAPANYLLVKDKAGKTSAGVISWGETLAGLSLSRDAMQAVVFTMAANMKKIDANCTLENLKKFTSGAREISESKQAGEDVYGVRFKGSWSEIWHFGVCGYDVGISIKFRADGSGGAHFETGSGVTAKKVQP